MPSMIEEAQYAHYDATAGKYRQVQCDNCKKTGGLKKPLQRPGGEHIFQCDHCGYSTRLINQPGEDVQKGDEDELNSKKGKALKKGVRNKHHRHKRGRDVREANALALAEAALSEGPEEAISEARLHELMDLPELLERGSWMQDAVKHPGSLRAALGVKDGENIPDSKLKAALSGKYGPDVKRKAVLARTFKRAHMKEGVDPEANAPMVAEAILGEAWSDLYNPAHNGLPFDFVGLVGLSGAYAAYRKNANRQEGRGHGLAVGEMAFDGSVIPLGEIEHHAIRGHYTAHVLSGESNSLHPINTKFHNAERARRAIYRAHGMDPHHAPADQHEARRALRDRLRANAVFG